MRATVYVVATFHRWGDELHAFGSEQEARACVMDYAEEFWDEAQLGELPQTYEELVLAWEEHGLWGSIESRWELQGFEIEVPAGSPAA